MQGANREQRLLSQMVLGHATGCCRGFALAGPRRVEHLVVRLIVRHQHTSGARRVDKRVLVRQAPVGSVHFADRDGVDAALA